MGVITNDDLPPAVFIHDVTVTEGDNGVVNANFRLQLSDPSGKEIRFSATTSDGTATATADYLARSTVKTFAPGTTRKQFVVPVLGDTLAEPNETFRARLAQAQNVFLEDGLGVGTIRNDD